MTINLSLSRTKILHHQIDYKQYWPIFKSSCNNSPSPLQFHLESISQISLLLYSWISLSVSQEYFILKHRGAALKLSCDHWHQLSWCIEKYITYPLRAKLDAQSNLTSHLIDHQSFHFPPSQKYVTTKLITKQYWPIFKSSCNNSQRPLQFRLESISRKFFYL